MGKGNSKKRLSTSSSASSTNSDNNGIQIGEIGYEFVKHFPSYGCFRGSVVQIRRGAKNNKTRRCRYTDGDEEDLSVRELYTLSKAEKKRQGQRARLAQRGEKYIAKKRREHSYSNSSRRNATATTDVNTNAGASASAGLNAISTRNIHNNSATNGTTLIQHKKLGSGHNSTIIEDDDATNKNGNSNGNDTGDNGIPTNQSSNHQKRKRNCRVMFTSNINSNEAGDSSDYNKSINNSNSHNSSYSTRSTKNEQNSKEIYVLIQKPPTKSSPSKSSPSKSLSKTIPNHMHDNNYIHANVLPSPSKTYNTTNSNTILKTPQTSLLCGDGETKIVTRSNSKMKSLSPSPSLTLPSEKYPSPSTTSSSKKRKKSLSTTSSTAMQNDNNQGNTMIKCVVGTSTSAKTNANVNNVNDNNSIRTSTRSTHTNTNEKQKQSKSISGLKVYCKIEKKLDSSLQHEIIAASIINIMPPMFEALTSNISNKTALPVLSSSSSLPSPSSLLLDKQESSMLLKNKQATMGNLNLNHFSSNEKKDSNTDLNVKRNKTSSIDQGLEQGIMIFIDVNSNTSKTTINVSGSCNIVNNKTGQTKGKSQEKPNKSKNIKKQVIPKMWTRGDTRKKMKLQTAYSTDIDKKTFCAIERNKSSFTGAVSQNSSKTIPKHVEAEAKYNKISSKLDSAINQICNIHKPDQAVRDQMFIKPTDNNEILAAVDNTLPSGTKTTTQHSLSTLSPTLDSSIDQIDNEHKPDQVVCDKILLKLTDNEIPAAVDNKSLSGTKMTIRNSSNSISSKSDSSRNQVGNTHKPDQSVHDEILITTNTVVRAEADDKLPTGTKMTTQNSSNIISSKLDSSGNQICNTDKPDEAVRDKILLNVKPTNTVVIARTATENELPPGTKMTTRNSSRISKTLKGTEILSEKSEKQAAIDSKIHVAKVVTRGMSKMMSSPKDVEENDKPVKESDKRALSTVDNQQKKIDTTSVVLKESTRQLSSNVKSKNEQLVRKSSRQIEREKAEGIGEIGYCFTKFFPGHGLFNGMVVQVFNEGDNSGASIRRCVYTDGDSEDITMDDLRALALLYPKTVTFELAKKQDSEVKSLTVKEGQKYKDSTKRKEQNHQKNDQTQSSDETNVIRNHVQAVSDWNTLDEVGEFEKANELLPPVDTAAEATFKICGNETRKKKSSHNDSSSDEDWLTEVATGLLVSSKSSKSQKKRASSHQEKPQESSRNISLANVKRGERHGCKVVNIKNSEGAKYIVGEVIVENKFGWVEVIEGEEVRKGRVGDYVVVSSDYPIGKEVSINHEENLALSDSSEVSSLSTNENMVTPSIPSSSAEPKISLESLFYWECHECIQINVFFQNECTSCNKERSMMQSSSSALLELAETATANANTYNQALLNIPENHRNSIPRNVLVECIRKKVNIESVSTFNSTATRNIIEYFYWNCGFCTMKNSYKVHTCKCCSQKKNELAESSILFKIASDASKSALHVSEAMSKIPSIHKPAIPISVMNALVTCIATVSKDNRRCLRPKVAGSDYCSVHNDPCAIALIDNQPKNNISCKRKERDIDNQESPKRKKRKQFKSIACLMDDVSNFFRRMSPHVKNLLRWDIQCTEDLFCSERNMPFALGLQVRRYFPGYGFHDGRITNIERKTVNEIGQERPVLVYRVEYNDGDREDLLHHEINSLRQMYDRTNIKPIASPNEQIPMGSKYETLLGVVEIINIDAHITNKADNGNVKAKFCKKGQALWSIVNLELTKLQVTVVRKDPSGINNSDQAPAEKSTTALLSPALDWPYSAPSTTETLDTKIGIEVTKDNKEGDEKFVVSDPALFISKVPLTFSISEEEEDLNPDQHQNQIQCTRPGVKQSGWDPAGGLDYLLWDPYDQIECEICKKGTDDRCILICDECNLGYHTYCLRPVVSNIPTDEWVCPDCSSGETGRDGFELLVKDLVKNFSQVASFLSLPFSNLSEIGECHKDVLEFISSTMPRSSRFVAFGCGKNKTLTAQVGGVHFNRRNCKHLWLIPQLQLQPNDSSHSFATMVAAMKYCGVTQYSEELVYAKGVSEDMNDASMDKIQKMSKDNTTIFRRYKENLKKGIYPPVEVVYDDELGFTVRALCSLPRHTILTEYVGEVTTIEKCYETNSDSLMILLETGDPKTSLIIDPTRISNIARFLSGVNNRSLKSRRKANVRTRRFVVDGKSRVALFTSRQIEAGESLNYDYNAGNEGKSVKDILRTGFYDTSKFL